MRQQHETAFIPRTNRFMIVCPRNCGKILFSVMSVCLSVCLLVCLFIGGAHLTTTDMFEFVHLWMDFLDSSPPPPVYMMTPNPAPPVNMAQSCSLDILNLVHLRIQNLLKLNLLWKRAVGIQLKSLLLVSYWWIKIS